jgi:hypothetical protein
MLAGMETVDVPGLVVFMQDVSDTTYRICSCTGQVYKGFEES